MNQSTILVIEDEIYTRELASRYLMREGYLVLSSTSSMDALKVLNLCPIDLVIIGMSIEDNFGRLLYNTIKVQYELPVLFIKSDELMNAAMSELYSDTDDFITKPFYPKELLDRVHLALNRQSKSTTDTQHILRAGPFQLDSNAKELYNNGDYVPLSRREYDLVEHLITNQNIVFSRSELLECVWGYDYCGDSRTVDTHIKKLRRKLDPESTYFKTVWGIGYKLKTR